MNLNPPPFRIRIRRIPGISISLDPSSLIEDSIFYPVSTHFTIEDDEENPSIIGETAYFEVIIENNSNTSITITSVEAMDISERSRNPLEEFPNSSEDNASVYKPWQLHTNSTRTFHFSKLLCDIGKHTIKVVLHYMDAVSSSTITGEYSFHSVKPFNLSFTRYQLSSTSYLINSTITNNLTKPLTITSVSVYNLISSMQEIYNSYSEPVFLQPGKKYSHSCILDGPLQEKAPVGSICIQFKTPGHEEIRLNSSTVTTDNLRTPSIQGYYEVDRELSTLQSSQITAVLINHSNRVQTVHLDWSHCTSPIQIIGECCFTRIIPPQNSIRLPLTILPLASGKHTIEIPRIQEKENGQEQAIRFSSISIFVQ